MDREEAKRVISNLLERRKKYLSTLAKSTKEIDKLAAKFNIKVNKRKNIIVEGN